MRRRLTYLQHILKQDETSLVKQFLRTQSISPKKKDWVTTVKEDLHQLKIYLSFLEIENMGKTTFKRLIRKENKGRSFEVFS